MYVVLACVGGFLLAYVVAWLVLGWMVARTLSAEADWDDECELFEDE